MNYENTYNNIISNAILSNRKKLKDIYFERHHILPKCMGGSNNNTNLVLLTAKEHFVCHHLLTKIYPDNSKLQFAFWAMCNQLDGDVKREYKINSTTYQKAKEQFAKVNSERHSGKKMPESHRIASSIRWKLNNPNKKGPENKAYGIPRTNEVKDKISKTQRANPEKNSNFKGYYITPFGKFASANEASRISKIGVDTIRKRCSNSDTVLTKRHIKGTIDLSISELGKTFKELGWDFLPVLSESSPSPE